jgi:hypothetical protein
LTLKPTHTIAINRSKFSAWLSMEERAFGTDWHTSIWSMEVGVLSNAHSHTILRNPASAYIVA